jgi:ribonuclease HI
VLSAWETIAYCQSAEIAEAIAALEETKAMLPVAARPVILESDSAAVVNELKMKDRSRSPLAFILSETRDMLLLLLDFKIQKVNRIGNSVAHDLASFGRSQKDCNSGCNQDAV